MDAKQALTNGSFCPAPWTGFMMEPDGSIKNCCCAYDPIGNVNQQPLEQILRYSPTTQKIKQDMIEGEKNPSCRICYTNELGVNSLNKISNRIFHLKKLKDLSWDTYDEIDNFDLRVVDLRWRNTCNFGCVYCTPVYSSKIASERKISVTVDEKYIEQVKNTVFDKVGDLKHVYLAGGEPLLLKENEEFLELLLKHNPNIDLRINTNLSRIDTRVFDLAIKFQNVQWIVSVDSMDQHFEYIRYGSKWTDFVDNLRVLRSLPHKISFNMLYLSLNHRALFDCIDWIKAQSFHDNAMVVTPLRDPQWLDVRNLPKSRLDEIKIELEKRYQNSQDLLQHGYRLLINHLDQPHQSNLQSTVKRLQDLDKIRKTNSISLFPEIHEWALTN